MFGLETWQLAILAAGAGLVGWPYLAPLAARFKPAPAPEPPAPRKDDPEVYYFRMYQCLWRRAEDRKSDEAKHHLNALLIPLFGRDPEPPAPLPPEPIQP